MVTFLGTNNLVKCSEEREFRSVLIYFNFAQRYCVYIKIVIKIFLSLILIQLRKSIFAL